MSLVLRYAARSDRGLIRGTNQDSVYAGPRLLAVADGMGGHAAGDVASKVVIAALEHLDEDAPSGDMLQALRFASILGASFTVTDLSVTMDRPVVELFGVLAEGIAGRVLEDDGNRLRFRHDVIRDAIYEDMPTTIRHGLHRERLPEQPGVHTAGY